MKPPGLDATIRPFDILPPEIIGIIKSFTPIEDQMLLFLSLWTDPSFQMNENAMKKFICFACRGLESENGRAMFVKVLDLVPTFFEHQANAQLDMALRSMDNPLLFQVHAFTLMFCYDGFSQLFELLNMLPSVGETEGQTQLSNLEKKRLRHYTSLSMAYSANTTEELYRFLSFVDHELNNEETEMVITELIDSVSIDMEQKFDFLQEKYGGDKKWGPLLAEKREILNNQEQAYYDEMAENEYYDNHNDFTDDYEHDQKIRKWKSQFELNYLHKDGEMLLEDKKNFVSLCKKLGSSNVNQMLEELVSSNEKINPTLIKLVMSIYGPKLVTTKFLDLINKGGGGDMINQQYLEKFASIENILWIVEYSLGSSMFDFVNSEKIVKLMVLACLKDLRSMISSTNTNILKSYINYINQTNASSLFFDLLISKLNEHFLQLELKQIYALLVDSNVKETCFDPLLQYLEHLFL